MNDLRRAATEAKDLLETWHIGHGTGEVNLVIENLEKALEQPSQESINIIIDGKDPRNPIFVEVEDSRGRSINCGKWLDAGDGLSKVIINTHPQVEPSDEDIVDIEHDAMIAWNKGADCNNQWDMLGDEEQLLLTARAIIKASRGE